MLATINAVPRPFVVTGRSLARRRPALQAVRAFLDGADAILEAFSSRADALATAMEEGEGTSLVAFEQEWDALQDWLRRAVAELAPARIAAVRAVATLPSWDDEALADLALDLDRLVRKVEQVMINVCPRTEAALRDLTDACVELRARLLAS